MAVRRSGNISDLPSDSTALKQSLKRQLAQSDVSMTYPGKSSTLPSHQLLEKLKALHLSLDESTQRHVSGRPSPINYSDFVEALEYDAKLKRWKLPEAITPLVQLSRNTQISGSNTCLQEGAATESLQVSHSQELFETLSEEVKVLYALLRGRKIAEDGVDIQHALLLKSLLQKYLSPSRKISSSEFKAVCSRFRQNPLCSYSELLSQSLSDADGFISESALDGLTAALKFTKVHGRSLHGNAHTEMRHPESNAVMLAEPQGNKKLETLAFKLSQRYRNLPLAFMKFDKDHDGLVSRKDFEESMEELNMDMTSNDVQEMFTLLDKSKHGSLTFDQFSKVKGETHLPKLELRSPRPQRYASVGMEPAGSPPPSRHSIVAPSSVSPSRLYFGPRRPQKALRQELPSDRNPEHTYGSRTRYSEDIKDLITNSYEREFLEKLRQRQQEVMRRDKRQVKVLTNSVVLRNEAIREKMEIKGEKQWKLPRFERKSGQRDQM